MGFFTNLDSQSEFRVTKPFNSLREIRWRAEQILKKKNMTREQLESAARGINRVISDYKEEKLAEELDRHVNYLYEQGGWELGLLEDIDNGRQPSRDEIRTLLENWPRWANDSPDIPTEENIYDLHALQDILISSSIYWNMDGSCDTAAESYAVLALMKLDVVIGLLTVPEKRTEKGILIYPGNHPWKTSDLIDAGNLIVEAMDIVCYAERTFSEEKLNEWRDEQKRKIDAERAAENLKLVDFSALGKAGAIKRYAPILELKIWAIDLYRSGNWKSANQAAHQLKQQILAHGKTISANLSEQNAQKTIAAWFSKSV